MMVEEDLPNHADFPFLPYDKPSQNKIYFTSSIKANYMILVGTLRETVRYNFTEHQILLNRQVQKKIGYVRRI